MIKYSSFTHSGNNKNNEDSILTPIASGQYTYFAVADGMGGESGGEIASSLVISHIEQTINENLFNIPELFSACRSSLINYVESNKENQKMGTTLTLGCLYNNKCYIGHVGDSRCYHLRNNGLKTKTLDQTEAMKLYEAGILSKQDMASYPRKNIIYSVISPSVDYKLFENQFDVILNDRILLVTDGVYNVLNKVEIRNLSINSKDVDEFCEKISKAVQEKGIVDDFSGVCIEIC